MIYNIIFTLLAPFFLLYTFFNNNNLGKGNYLYRFGIISSEITDNLDKNKETVWIHAVSVGEINAITSLVNNLREKNPNINLIISTITATGQKVAKENFSNEAKIIFLPFDFFWAAKRIMNLIKPDVFITIETEIWPNMIKYADKVGANILMINGRLSPRSIKNYQRLKSFIKKVLGKYDLFSVIMPHDAERLKTLGASENKIVINGNSKYDHLTNKIDENIPRKIKSKFNISKNHKVIIAGSTRGGEDKIIINTFKKLDSNYENLILITAPRHINRAKHIKNIAYEEGLSSIMKTEIDNGKKRINEKIIIINTIGDLFDIYSIGDIIFCGASLVPKGGQNIMEPAVWGKSILYGPSMNDFADAKDILEEVEAGIQVDDQTELYNEINYLLDYPEKNSKIGDKAKKAVFSNKGASERNVELITQYI